MRAAGDVDALVRRLRASEGTTPVPLLVVRLRGLERIAWREGRNAARAAEARSLRSFVETASRTLRAGDVLAHDAESQDFLAALVSPGRSDRSGVTPADCRATLGRLAAAMERSGGMQSETGWTVLERIDRDERLSNAVEAALERGARERERFAFFSTVGHELRTPLTSVRGYLETLLEEDVAPSKARHFLEVARLEAMRMSRLVEDMFELSMLDMHDGSRHSESSSLEAVLHEAVEALGPAAAERGTTIALVAVVARRVDIARDRLAQIVINVIENAVKHGKPSGAIEVSAAMRGGRYVEVRVDDDGPGVVPEDREAIFSLARRGGNVRARGSGIGLAVARLLVERAGGDIDVVESHLGGARFRLRLPLCDARDGRPDDTPGQRSTP